MVSWPEENGGQGAENVRAAGDKKIVRNDPLMRRRPCMKYTSVACFIVPWQRSGKDVRPTIDGPMIGATIIGVGCQVASIKQHVVRHSPQQKGEPVLNLKIALL